MLRVRKNLNSLTATEKADLIRAIKALKADGTYDRYIHEHHLAMMEATVLPGEPNDSNYRNVAHRGPAFGPWHREFLRRFELDLQAAVPGVTLPYWDWSADPPLADPRTAPVWGNDLMGGDGVPANGNLVGTGPFRYDPADPDTWKVVTDDGDPGPGLTRTLGQGQLPSKPDVDDVLEITPYDAFPWNATVVGSFRNQLEGWRGPNLHNAVHVWVGGSMLPGTSPNDPVFFLHHCNVDRLWWEWQRRHPDQGYAPTAAGPPGHNLADGMSPWDQTTPPATPAGVLDIHQLGYRYDTDPPAGLSLVIDRSTFGQDEVRAGNPTTAAPLVVDPAFWVVVDGCTAKELGLTTANLSNPPLVPTITLTPAAPGMTVRFVGPVVAEDPALPPTPQRFRFQFAISFTSDAAFDFVGDLSTVGLSAALTVSASTLTAAGLLQLIKQANPYMLDGPTWWLSVDLRVFTLRAGDTRFGATLAADAPGYIRSVIADLNTGHGTAGGQRFDDLPEDHSASRLELSPTDSSGTTVYNFALARVRLRGLTMDARNTRVFFRLVAAQTTNWIYDLTAGYRRFSDGIPGGHTIALPGIRGGEYVSVPCFASARVDTSTVSMSTQTDPANVRTIVHDPGGTEVHAYYGCWLDINQPTRPVLPAVPPTNLDGPFAAGTALPIQRAILRSPHQCLVAEIAFDPAPIPAGVVPSSTDKLTQRNLAWISIPNPGHHGSRRVPQTFEVAATPAAFAARPDELMIDWADLPAGATAQIYLPSLDVGTILELADSLYGSRRLQRVDDHTLSCDAATVTYLPIPAGARRDHAGLLSVELPAGVRRGQMFGVKVRQITLTRAPVGQLGVHAFATETRALQWQRVIGGFGINIPVETKAILLPREERLLSLMAWIGETIPAASRWRPVFDRYLDQVADRVDDLGGCADSIAASPTGRGRARRYRCCRWRLCAMLKRALHAIWHRGRTVAGRGPRCRIPGERR